MPLTYARYDAKVATPFRSGRKLAKTVNALLLVLIGLTVLSMAGGVWSNLHMMQHGYSPDEWSTPEIANTCISAGLLVARIPLIVFFLIWMHRAARNLPALGLAQPTISPGWAVGWWFIPFANLVKPYQAMKEIWTASDPPPGAVGADAPLVRRPDNVLGYWWASWLISNIIANIAARVMFRVDSAEALIACGWVLIGSDALEIGAAVLLMMIVRTIDVRQECRLAALAVPGPGVTPLGVPHA